MNFWTRKRQSQSGMSLGEVMVALAILLVAILTMVGYIATVHRAAREGKSQAVATMYARSMLERVRDSQADFQQAASPAGLQETRQEVLLSGEANPHHNETGKKGAMTYNLDGRAALVGGHIYSLVVRVTWSEASRRREIVLESRGLAPPL